MSGVNMRDVIRKDEEDAARRRATADHVPEAGKMPAGCGNLKPLSDLPGTDRSQESLKFTLIETEIYEAWRAHGPTSRARLMELTGHTDYTVRKTLRDLRAKGVLG